MSVDKFLKKGIKKLSKIRSKFQKKYYSIRIEDKFKKDPNWKRADIYKAFSDRKIQGNDQEILNRIIKAYNLAKEKQETAQSVYQVSNEWVPIYNNHMGNIMNVLQKGNIDELQKIYDNFWRDPCSTGLHGLSSSMQKNFFGKKISNKNKKLFLSDFFHRYHLWKDLLGYKYSIKDLEAPIIGNPYGLELDGAFVKAGSDCFHYYATGINRMLSAKNKKTTILELGGGFGGMAYYLCRDNRNCTYIDLDLPENTALASFHLLKAFPEKRIVLYGEAEINKEIIENNDILMLPCFAVEEIPDLSADLFFNSYSLAEMEPSAISNYLVQMKRITKRFFYHVNHINNCVLSADKFDIDADKFSLIYRIPALWNLAQNINMDEYEFLYERA